MNRWLFLAGMLLLVVPVGWRVWDKKQQDSLIDTYMTQVEELENEDAEECMEDARIYNQRLYQTGKIDLEWYNKSLDLFENGMMGSIEIPRIALKLPIYHGTEEETLANGIGHLKESSLPVGGINSHCILTGHRGLPDAQLFTRLDELEIGDQFYLYICEEKLSYRVCEIQVVKPEEVEILNIHQGEDLVSLITCTPYGINTHRLVVTGKRVNEKVDSHTIEADVDKETEKVKQSGILSTRDKILLAIPGVTLCIPLHRKVKKLLRVRRLRRAKRRRAMKGKMTGVVISLFLLCAMNASAAAVNASAATGSIKVDVSEEDIDQIFCIKVGDMESGEFYLGKSFQEADVDLNTIKNARQVEQAAKELMRFVNEESADRVALNHDAKFENLEDGVYLIYSGEKNMLPTLVYVPMWDEMEKTMDYNIQLQPKFASQKHSPQTGWESGAGEYFALLTVSFGTIWWISKHKIIKYG